MKLKRILAISALAALVIAALAGWMLWLKPLYEQMGGVYGLRDWLSERALAGRIIFVLIVAVQIIVAVIPGGPIELAGGYAFGLVEGTVLCMIGMVIGSMSVFLLVKTLGMRVVKLFVSEQQLNSLPIWKNKRRLELIAFLLFLIPGTPKDALTYAMGLTPVKWTHWLVICSVARIPSVLATAAWADAAATGSYMPAIITLIFTAALALGAVLLYKHEEKKNT